jgi:hypothetical protein
MEGQSPDEEHSRLGWFWLPDSPDQRVPGVLSVTGLDIEVQLLGSFEPDRRQTVFFPGASGHDVIHAQLVNPRTPASVFGASLMFLLPGERSVFDARALLETHGGSPDLIDLRGLSFEVSGVSDVVLRGTQTVTLLDPDADIPAGQPRATVGMADLAPFRARFGNGDELFIHIGTSLNLQPETRIQDLYRCEITSSAPRSLEGSLQAARVLRDLVELLTCSPQGLSAFTCTLTDDSTCAFRFPRLEHRVAEPPDRFTVHRRRLLSLHDFLTNPAETSDDEWSAALASIAAGWPEWRHRYATAVDNMLRPERQAEPSPREQFLAAFESLETYANARVCATVQDAEHSARVAAVLAALPGDLAERPWVESILKAKKNKGQARLLQEVIDATPASEFLVEDPKTFAEQVTSFRGALAHGERQHERDELDRLARTLRALLVLAYLGDSGRQEAESITAATAMATRLQT